MKHRLYIMESAAGDRIGSIKAVNADSAVRGFRRVLSPDRRRGIRARKAREGER